jgi:protein-tyrosine phosphatase
MCSNHFDWILEDVALGNIIAGSQLNELQKNNISAVVAILPHLPHKSSHYVKNGFSLFHIPLFDAPNEDISKWFDHVSDFIMAHRFMKRKILVHCHAGISRSTTLVASFLMNLKNWNHNEAIRYIRTKRSCVNPNTGFLKQLSKYKGNTRPEHVRS